MNNDCATLQGGEVVVHEAPTGRHVWTCATIGKVLSSFSRPDGHPRPVQKHKRTQDWRAGPFRSSSTRGEPQIWGVSEAMSAIRVLRTRRENNVQQGDATLPGGDLDPGPGPHLDQNVLARHAAVAPAPILWAYREASFPPPPGPASARSSL